MTCPHSEVEVAVGVGGACIAVERYRAAGFEFGARSDVELLALHHRERAACRGIKLDVGVSCEIIEREVGVGGARAREAFVLDGDPVLIQVYFWNVVCRG